MKSQIVTSKNNNEELSPARWRLRFTESSNRSFFALKSEQEEEADAIDIIENCRFYEFPVLY